MKQKEYKTAFKLTLKELEMTQQALKAYESIPKIWYKPKKWTCKNCGKDFYVFHYSPRKFCSHGCYTEYRKKQTLAKYKRLITTDDIKMFYKRWQPYIKYTAEYRIYTYHDDVYNSLIEDIPGIVYNLKKTAKKIGISIDELPESRIKNYIHTAAVHNLLNIKKANKKKQTIIDDNHFDKLVYHHNNEDLLSEENVNE